MFQRILLGHSYRHHIYEFHLLQQFSEPGNAVNMEVTLSLSNERSLYKPTPQEARPQMLSLHSCVPPHLWLLHWLHWLLKCIQEHIR